MDDQEVQEAKLEAEKAEKPGTSGTRKKPHRVGFSLTQNRASSRLRQKTSRALLQDKIVAQVKQHVFFKINQ